MKVENGVYPSGEQIAGFLQSSLAVQLNIETVDGAGLWLGQTGFGRG